MKCRICQVNLETPEIMEQHFSGKKHLKKQGLEASRGKQEGKQVYVGKLGILRLSNIQAHFSQFGTITNIIICWDKQNQDKMFSLIIEFEDEESVIKILSRSQRFSHKIFVDASKTQSHTVRVFERISKARPRSPSPPAPSTISFDEIKLVTSVMNDLEEQIWEIMSIVELGREDVDERFAICQNISKTFAVNGYPNCTVSPFGSTVNGLGFRGCDVDIFLDLGHEIRENKSESTGGSTNEETQQQQVQKVRLAARLLRTIPHCCRILTVTTARVPIVKFIHSRTGIQCDISFKNRASVINSEYIRQCTEQDSRIRPLMMAIRLICKRYDLAGGGGGTRISSYALTMWIILYLQQLHKPLLHPVHVLNKYSDGNGEIIEGWKFCLCSDMSKVPPLLPNQQGLFDLFIGFFKYYSELDFENTFLSPYLGRAIPRTDIEDKLPEEYTGLPNFFNETSFKTDRLIWLQDPFELSFNVCKNLPLRGLATIRAVFNLVYTTSVYLKENICPGGFNKLLNLEIRPQDISIPEPAKIFDCEVFTVFYLPHITPNTLQSVLSSSTETIKTNINIQNSKNENSTPDVDETAVDTSKLSVADQTDIPTKETDMETQEDSNHKEGQETNIVETNQSEDDGDELDRMNKLLAIIFEKAFKFIKYTEPSSFKEAVKDENVILSKAINQKRKSVSTDEVANGKKARLETEETGQELEQSHESTKDVTEQANTEHDTVLTQEWAVYHHIWGGRKRLQDQIDDNLNLNVFQKECLVTEKQFQNFSINILPPEVIFRCHIKKYQNKICFGLEKISSRKKIYENLFSWFRTYLPELLKKLSSQK